MSGRNRPHLPLGFTTPSSQLIVFPIAERIDDLKRHYEADGPGRISPPQILSALSKQHDVYSVEPLLMVTSLVRKPPHYSHRYSVPNCIPHCPVPWVTVIVRFHCMISQTIYLYASQSISNNLPMLLVSLINFVIRNNGQILCTWFVESNLIILLTSVQACML